MGTCTRLMAMKANMARSHFWKLPRRHDRHQRHRRDGYRDVLRDPGVGARQRDPDELGDDGQEVEEKEVPDAEPAPPATESLVDEPGMADAGDRAQPDHHLLVDDQHRDEQQKGPQQGGVVVLAGLGVGGDAAGVVVADHHDDARAHDGGQGQEALLPGVALADVADGDAAEGALDVAEVGLVEDGRGRRLQLAVRGFVGAVESAAPEPSAPLAVTRSVTGYPLGSGREGWSGLLAGLEFAGLGRVGQLRLAGRRAAAPDGAEAPAASSRRGWWPRGCRRR